MRMVMLAAVMGAGLGLALAGCQQPYRVFAVQVAAADTATGAPSAALADQRPADPAPLATPVGQQSSGGMRAGHPQWDLNRVPAQTLLGLPGMTAELAEAIVSGRPYRSKRELVKRKIVTAVQYARWKDYLVVHRDTATSRGSAATRR